MSTVDFTVKQFKDFLSQNKVMGSRCKSCGATFLPPRPICPDCSGKVMEWVELKGKGTVQAYTVIHVPSTRMKGQSPYELAVVKLEEGPSISGRIVRATAGKGLTVGDRVEARFVKDEGKTLLCFQPV